jgi:hypothetical protein
MVKIKLCPFFAPNLFTARLCAPAVLMVGPGAPRTRRELDGKMRNLSLIEEYDLDHPVHSRLRYCMHFN